MATIFQAGVFVAFLQGVYEGDVTFKTLAEHGDTGLGTFNHIDGEMIALEGTFYRINSQGVASSITDLNTLTPFAIVSKFNPTLTFPVNNLSSITELNQLLDTLLKNKNIFYLLRINGEFQYLKMRSEICYTESTQTLAKILPKLQNVYTVEKTCGTLIATWFPPYTATFTIPGYHYHFIDDARKIGGHVFDLELVQAEINIMPIKSFHIDVFDNKNFAQADLNIDMKSALKEFEDKFSSNKE